MGVSKAATPQWNAAEAMRRVRRIACDRPHLIEIDQKQIGACVGEGQTISVHSEKCGCYSDRHALVAVDKRMILRRAFPKRCSLFNEIPVIAGLRPGVGRFKRAPVPKAVRPSEALNQRPMYRTSAIAG